MAEQQLVDYIKKAKEAGQADEQTKSLLTKNGWTEAEVNDAFAAANPQAQPQVASQPKVEAKPEIMNQPQPQVQAQPQYQPQVVAQQKPQPQYQPQPQVQPQPAQNNMPKMRGKSHLILKLLIVLIVLIVICVVGYFVISQNLLGTPTPVVNSPVQPVVTPVASAVAPTPTETPTPTPTPAPWCYTFTKNLGFADSGTNDIVQLHMAMQKEGFSYAPDGDNVYSDGTSKALIQFQTKYGIAPLSGFVGTKTRAQLNTLYGCPATPTPTPAPAAAVPTQPAP